MQKTEQLVRKYLQPVLKKAGFKKKGYIWNRQRDSLIDVFDIQKAKNSTFESEQIVINIGIFVPNFYLTIWQRPHKGFALEADCPVRIRIGALLEGNFSGDALDTWWTLTCQKDIDEVGVYFKNAIEKSVLSFYEQIDSIQKVHNFISEAGGWQKKYPLMQIYLALANNIIGEKHTCDEILDSIIQGSNKAWAKRAKLIKTELNM